MPDRGAVTYSNSMVKEGNSCAVFNGVSSLISKDVTFSTNAFTQGYWVYVDSNSVFTDPDILTWGYYYAYVYPNIESDMYIDAYVTDKVTSIGGESTDNVILPDQWNHVVLTYDGTTTSVYINGTLSLSEVATVGDSSLDISLLSLPFWVGGNVGDENDYFLTGYLDDIIIWDRALSSSEVLDYYSAYRFFHSTTGRFSFSAISLMVFPVSSFPAPKELNSSIFRRILMSFFRSSLWIRTP